MWFKRFILLVLFFSSAYVGAMGHAFAQSWEEPLMGKAAPDAVLPKSDGASASIMNAREGKKGILVFWATWCPHCYVELGKINDALPSLQKKGIKIILVDVGESKEQVEEYLLRRQMDLSSFIDGENVLQEPYDVLGVPTMFFIDEQGTVRDVTHQFPSDYEDHFS